MARINPYRFLAGEIPDKLGRWLEELRRQLNTNTLAAEPANEDTGSVGSEFIIFKEEDTARDTTIVSTADPELTAGLLGSSLYGIEGEIKIASSDVQGFRFTIDGPLIASWEWSTTDAGGVHNTGLGAKGVDQVFTETDASQTIRFGGMCKTTVAATLAFAWAQETSDAGSTSVLQGSWMRITRLTVEGPPAAADIADFIASLGTAVTHRWKHDEVAVPLLDTGDGSAIDLTEVGTMGGFELGGPDDSTESIDYASSSTFVRNTSVGFSSAATGTVLAFVKNFGTTVTVVCNSNTVNEAFTFSFGMNPQGTGTPNRIGASMFLANLFNRRQWIGSTDTTSWSADGLWHLIGWVADGSGTMRINVDGVEDTVSEATLGTPPASSAWFTDVAQANSRGVLGNNRFSSGSGNMTGEASEVLILDGVELTEAQFAELFSLITN
jgi:hypothetical protein